MDKRIICRFGAWLVACLLIFSIFILAGSAFSQDIVRTTSIPIPEPDLNVGGIGNMISGVDLDGDGMKEIYVVNDNWNNTPNELIPRIYKYEKGESGWEIVWQAEAPISQQNTWPALSIGDLDGDDKKEILWGVVNNFGAGTNPDRILVYEVVDNSIDEALAGYCNKIRLTIHKDNSITVEDNGRGIPVAMHPIEKVSALELVMCTLHAGGKFDHSTYKVSGGLHGVGVSVVNALSEWMIAEIKRDGGIYRQSYKNGEKTSEVERFEDSHLTGTKINFKPDTLIFTETIVFKVKPWPGRPPPKRAGYSSLLTTIRK